LAKVKNCCIVSNYRSN